LRSGKESAMSVMQARRTLLSARLAAAAATGAMRQSDARLAYSAGTGSSHVQ
jgi:outer membrane protein TolC